jgi:O-antigen/teichoic acid export membrane protein
MLNSVDRKIPLAGRLLSHLRLPLYRNGYLLTFSSVASSGLGLVYWMLAARYYPANVVGLNSALISAMMLLAGISLFSLNTALIRFVPLAGRATPRLIVYSYLFSLTTSAVISIVFCVAAGSASPTFRFLADNPIWLMSFVLATMAWCIFSLQDSALIGLRQSAWVPIENITFAVIKIVLLIAFAVILQQSGLFASWNIPVIFSLPLVNFLIFRRLVQRHVRATTDRAAPLILSQIIKYSAGNYLGTLFFLASTTLLPIIVASQLGAAANAYFYIPWTIASGLQLVAFNMTTSLTVEATFDRAQLASYCRRVLKQTLRLMVPLVIVILLGANIILLLFGPAYAAEGAALLRWLSLATLPNVVVAVAISLARVKNNAGMIVLIQGSLCVLGLGLSYALFPVTGITGVGIAWLVSQTLVALILALTVLRPILLPNMLPGHVRISDE